MAKYFSYAYSLFKTEDLKHWADLYMKALPEDVTCLLTRGSSGCAIASAIMMLSDRTDLHHIHLKKVNEKSHSEYAGTLPAEGEVMAIVDDFADTGKTVDTLLEWAQQRGRKVSYVILHHTSKSFMHYGVPVKIIALRR